MNVSLLMIQKIRNVAVQKTRFWYGQERISVPSLVNRQLHMQLVRLGNIKPLLLEREMTS